MIFDALPAFAIVIAGAIYLRGMARGRFLLSWRVACFVAGVLIIGIALYAPVHEVAHGRFSAHMLQHVLLMSAAAPLVVLGDGARVLRRGSPRPLLQLLARTPRELRDIIHNPIVCTAAAVAVLWGWHLPVLYEAALDDRFVHWLQHLSFFVTSLLVWSVAFGTRRASEGTALAVIFASSLAGAALGAIITFAGSVLYPSNLASGASDPLVDQQLAGAIMWIPPGIVNLVAMVILLTRLVGERPQPVSAGSER